MSTDPVECKQQSKGSRKRHEGPHRAVASNKYAAGNKEDWKYDIKLQTDGATFPWNSAAIFDNRAETIGNIWRNFAASDAPECKQACSNTT